MIPIFIHTAGPHKVAGKKKKKKKEKKTPSTRKFKSPHLLRCQWSQPIRYGLAGTYASCQPCLASSRRLHGVMSGEPVFALRMKFFSLVVAPRKRRWNTRTRGVATYSTWFALIQRGFCGKGGNGKAKPCTRPVRSGGSNRSAYVVQVGQAQDSLLLLHILPKPRLSRTRLHVHAY